MRLRKSLAANGLAIVLSQLVSFAFGMLASVLITRHLGPEAYGQYAQIIWLGSTLGTIAIFGFGNGLTRFVAKLEASADATQSRQLVQFTTLFVVLIVLALGALLLIGAHQIAPLVGLNRPQYVWVALFSVCAAPVTMLLVSPLKGKQRFQEVAVLMFLISLTSAAAQICAVVLNASVAWVAASSGAGAIFAVCYGLRIGRMPLLPRSIAPFDRSLIRSFLKYSAVMGAVFLTDAVVWQRSEMLFLGYFGMTTDAGFYSIAYSLSAAPMLLIPGAVGTMTLPIATAHAHSGENDKLSAVLQNSVRYTLLLGCPIAALGMLVGPLLLRLLYGSQYQASATLLAILVWGALAGVTAWNAASLLQARGKPQVLLLIGVAAGLSNILLDYQLIRRFGAVGAASANTLSGLMAAALVILAARRILALEFHVSVMLRVLLATAIALLPAYLVITFVGDRPIAATCLSALSFTATYCLMVILLKSITTQEVGYLLRLPAQFGLKRHSSIPKV